MQSAIEQLREQELAQQENLMEVLSVINGSKSATKTGNLLSIARGLCTINNKILVSLATCMEEAETQGIEAYKNFVSEFILWFSGSSAVFERYLHCLPIEGLVTESIHQKTLMHYSNYLPLIDVALRSLRNPFVVDKLKDAKLQIEDLLAKNQAMMRRSVLDNITFDQVQGFGGLTVSCFFTVDQIVERTNENPLFMGKTKVELVLLNLDKESSMYTMRDFNALAILKVDGGSRAVVYPPFRINDLSMSLSYNCINFSSVAYASESEGSSFALTGSESLIQEWYEKLKLLFPAADEVLQSEVIQLEGLGINTISQSFREENVHAFDESLSPAYPSQSHRNDSAEFEKENFSTGLGICAPSYSNNDDSSPSGQSLLRETSSQSDICSINSDDFEIVTKDQVLLGNKQASQSLPELQKKAEPVFQNAAGSAIDITNFGKDHNPTFTPQLKPNLEKGKKTFFGMFRKKAKDDKGQSSVEQKQTTKASQVGATEKKREPKKKEPKKQEVEEKKDKDLLADLEGKLNVTAKSSEIKQVRPKQQERARPALTISIPKTLDAPKPAFSSLKSNQFSPGSTLPLPFALPSSTSTYYFKQYLDGPNLAGGNGSTTSLNQAPPSLSLNIPQGLKDEINSENSLDFYISPSSTKTLKVSKWKARVGKWEMLSTSDDIFVKIVVNYILDKRWLLVFEEQSIDGEIVDRPLLILELTNQSKFRRSSASDIEIGALNCITKEKMLIIIRCYKGEVFDALYSGLSNNLEAMKSPVLLQKSTNYESNGTLTSSLMSRPSTTSTLASLYTSLEQTSTSDCDYSERGVSAGGDRVLLERMTVKLHKQMESYDKIHQLSTWKALSMYSLSLSHSVDEFGTSFYHFELNKKRGSDDAEEEFEWTFNAGLMSKNIEKIGKAGLLVKPDAEDIYMLECKGSKELSHLFSTFK